jgi:hypothetical protein
MGILTGSFDFMNSEKVRNLNLVGIVCIPGFGPSTTHQGKLVTVQFEPRFEDFADPILLVLRCYDKWVK